MKQPQYCFLHSLSWVRNSKKSQQRWSFSVTWSLWASQRNSCVAGGSWTNFPSPVYRILGWHELNGWLNDWNPPLYLCPSPFKKLIKRFMPLYKFYSMHSRKQTSLVLAYTVSLNLLPCTSNKNPPAPCCLTLLDYIINFLFFGLMPVNYC